MKVFYWTFWTSISSQFFKTLISLIHQNEPSRQILIGFLNGVTILFKNKHKMLNISAIISQKKKGSNIQTMAIDRCWCVGRNLLPNTMLPGQSPCVATWASIFYYNSESNHSLWMDFKPIVYVYAWVESLFVPPPPLPLNNRCRCIYAPVN